MDKMKMHTVDITDSNIEKIGQLFPNCLTEHMGEDGKVEKVIDFDQLRQELSKEIVEGPQERYQFTWPDKKKAILASNASTTMTLRPIRTDETKPSGADSEGNPYCSTSGVDFENTKNLYIEGDNLEVLKLLQEDYLGKVKMIYIDPPYNTGNDFIYDDDFSQDLGDYNENSGQYDTSGNRMVQNIESNGRFHTDWLNMMYSRLKLSRSLLSPDGAIFISIDDHEIENLKKICNEVFGGRNFVACVVWQRTYAPISLKKYFSESHDFCVIYAKDIDSFKMNLLPRSDKQNKDYKNPDNDPRGPWKVGNLTVGPAVEKQIYPITGPTGKTFMPPSGYCWRFTKERFEQMRADNRIWFGADGSNSPVPKLFLSEVQDGVTPMTLWTFDEVGHGQEATRELRDLMGAAVFTSPKPLRYMKRLLQIGSNKDSLILDFFSGSASTAHAIMKLNSEDGGNRQFIMVQLPEVIGAKEEAYKAGYKNICEIGKERIRRAGKKIMEEQRKSESDGGLFAQVESKPTVDVGFRVLKLDSSNMNDVYYKPEEFSEQLIKEDNVKDDRTSEDLLFQVMLECNLPLSAKIKTEKIAGKEVFSVNNGYLVACFDENIDEAVIKDVAKRKPYYFVMRDSSLASDNVADNFEQIFQAYSKDTIRKII